MGCEGCLSKMFRKKRGSRGKLKDSKDRSTLKQRVSFGTGHIFNDLCSAVWFTYFIVYFNKVVGLSSSQTGLLFLIAQCADAILTPITGIGCDRFVIKPFSRYGKRKSWHLFGTIAQAIIWPFILSPCFVCSSDSPNWLPMLYYAVGVILLHVGSPAVEFAHLSLIPEIAKRSTEIVELTAIRSAMSFFCGIYIYVITWILLGQESEKAISPKLKNRFYDFRFNCGWNRTIVLGYIHWGTTEPVSSSTNKDTVPLESPNVDPSQSKQDFRSISKYEWDLFIASSIVLLRKTRGSICRTVSERQSAYAEAFLIGSGNSVMLVVMALSMIADLIGNDKRMNCEEWCMNYVRLVFTLAPGVAAALAMLIVAIFFNPQVVLSCRSIVETMDQGTQTTENGVSDLQATDAVADISCTGV
ncbi:uncharacterized protein [Acropora muricata]|uniref:uncharacterized protein n=1 Tax=Acropora muricata TaxID=159855 RepID=UPI0034E54CAE